MFFFQAEDGIRDTSVTGVQTCALPISRLSTSSAKSVVTGDLDGNGIDEVIADFGSAHGIWVYYNHSTWVQLHPSRSEERRVGKECRVRWQSDHETEHQCQNQHKCMNEC